MKALLFIFFIICFLESSAQQKVSSLKSGAYNDSMVSISDPDSAEITPVSLSAEKMPAGISSTVTPPRIQAATSSPPVKERETTTPVKASGRIEGPRK